MSELVRSLDRGVWKTPAFWLIVAGAAVARIVFVMNYQGEIPNSDELWRMNLASMPLYDCVITPFLPDYSTHLGYIPWLDVFLLRAAGGFSAPILMLRLFSAFIGVLLAGVSMVFMERLWDRRTAIVAGLLFGFHPQLLWASQEIKGFILQALLMAIGTYLFMIMAESRERSSLRTGVVAGMSLGLAVASHLLALVPSVLLIAMGLLYGVRGRIAVVIAAIFSLIIAPIMLAPFYHLFFAPDFAALVHVPAGGVVTNVSTNLAQRILLFPPRMGKELLFSSFAPLHSGYLCAIIVPLLVWGIFRSPARPAARIPLFTAFLFFFAVYLLSIVRPSYVFIRYFILAIPLLLIIVIHAIMHLETRLRAPALACLLLPYLGSVYTMATDIPGRNEWNTMLVRQTRHDLDRDTAAPLVLWANPVYYLEFRYLQQEREHAVLPAAGYQPPERWWSHFRNWPGRGLSFTETTIAGLDRAEILAQGDRHLEEILVRNGYRNAGKYSLLLDRFERRPNLRN